MDFIGTECVKPQIVRIQLDDHPCRLEAAKVAVRVHQVIGRRGTGGSGIQQVFFSEDGGRSWRDTTLGQDLGKYSFREWTTIFTPKAAGKFTLKVKAISRNGQSQPEQPLWNPAGYMRNVIESVTIHAV